MIFHDRQDAALQLLPYLENYQSKNVIVLAVPRGGVPIGCILAKSLKSQLDLLMTKKIGAPGNAEFAIGAVGPDFVLIEDEFPVDRAYLQHETKRIQRQLKERYQLFRKGQPPLPLQGKTVIITDDGIATGRTLLAAISALRQKNPAAIIIAVPVCSVQARTRLEPLVNKLISIDYPDPFIGVGRFYENFEEVTDEQVRLLVEEMQKSPYA